MVVTLDAGFRRTALRMAEDRRERCRELGRVDQSTGTDEQKLEYEIIGAAGELAVARAFNLCPDFGGEAGEADYILPDGRTVDVKTVAATTKRKNLLVRETAVHCDAYILVEQLKNIWDGEYEILGWESGEAVRATPVGEVVDFCHFVHQNELREVNSADCLASMGNRKTFIFLRNYYLPPIKKPQHPGMDATHPTLAPFKPKIYDDNLC
tara:strand:- start:438 stop:1067 length:630 start_codon:yes stop_codon:yes gene_type:complete